MCFINDRPNYYQPGSNYDNTYKPDGWLGRKVVALPLALWCATFQPAYHFFTKDRQTYGKCIKADYQEAYGWLITLFSDRLGLYHVDKAHYDRNPPKPTPQPPPPPPPSTTTTTTSSRKKKQPTTPKGTQGHFLNSFDYSNMTPDFFKNTIMTQGSFLYHISPKNLQVIIDHKLPLDFSHLTLAELRSIKQENFQILPGEQVAQILDGLSKLEYGPHHHKVYSWITETQKAYLDNINKLPKLLKNPDTSYAQLMTAYNPHYKQVKNAANLSWYANSPQREEHNQSACIYYNSKQLSQQDAFTVATHREPTNIAMGPNQYNADVLQDLYGYRTSAFNDPGLKTTSGHSFKDLPHTVAVYSQAFVWDLRWQNPIKKVSCLSVPAPALDTRAQPHFNYYVPNGNLDTGKYEEEIQFLFKCIEQAALDHKEATKRVVVSKFGQGAFLAGLKEEDRKEANAIFSQELEKFTKKMEIPVYLSLFSPNEPHWIENVVIGDIIESCFEGDLIVNAWDPHSFPGNGNDNDASFDGAMGACSSIIFSQSPHLNPELKKESAFKSI